jgi:flagellar motor switch protein FliN/FliY
MLVRDVIELGTGSVVEIDKAAGEPVDVMVNGRIVARGEVVVIEDNFGVRVTEILSPQERLLRLAEVA